MMRTLVLAALLLGALPATAADISGRATVVDGDTIGVEGTKERIRLYGIDAPEKGQTCEDADGKRYLCGGRAAEALASIIGRNGRVSCVEEDRDRYGRIVATCRVRGADISEAMVRQGWARDFTRYSKRRYEAVQRDAEQARRGLWAGDWQDPTEWRKAKRKR